MIQKLFNFALALIFIILVILFAYKMTLTPDVVSVPVQDSSAEATKEKSDVANTVARDNIQQVIKDYIMNNPEVIVQSLEGLHNKKLDESTRKTTDYLRENKAQIEEAEFPPILGNPNGDIVIVAFYDYNCSFCKKANDYENEIIASDPGVKVVLRPIPILGGTSTYAAKIAIAVQRVSSNNFLNVHNELMRMKEISEENVKTMLAKYSIDYSLIENEVNSYSVRQIIAKNFDLAKELGIKGTPSYVINGNFAPGLIPTEKFKSIIVQLRASAQETPASVQEHPKEHQEEEAPSAEDKSSNASDTKSVTDK
jgi:protein-disulfide isomerase